MLLWKNKFRTQTKVNGLNLAGAFNLAGASKQTWLVCFETSMTNFKKGSLDSSNKAYIGIGYIALYLIAAIL